MRRSTKIIIAESIVLCLLLSLPLTAFSQRNTVREWGRLATQYERLGRYDLAADYYIRLLQANEKDVSSYLGAKRCLTAIKEYDRFNSLILTLQKKRRDLRYEVDLAELDYLRGMENSAMKRWEKIIEDNSRNHQVYSLVGAVWVQHRLYDRAIHLYEKARVTFNDPSLFVFEIVNILRIRADYQRVADEYLNYLQRHPQQISFVESQLVDICAQPGAANDIVSTLRNAIGKNSQLTPAIHQLLSTVYTRMGQIERAFPHILERQRFLSVQDEKSKKPPGEDLFRFASTAIAENYFEIARVAFQELIERHPDTPYALRAKLGLAQVLDAQGEFAGAISAYEQFASLHPRSAEAVKALLRAGEIWQKELYDLKRAEDAYQRIIRAYPSSRSRQTAAFRIGECAMLSDDLERAKTVYSSMLPSLRASERNRALLALAKLAFYQGLPSKALGHLQDIVGQRTAKPDVYENDALELLLLIQASKDSLAMADLGRARLLDLQRKNDESLPLLQRALNRAQPGLLRDEIALTLAEQERKAGNYDQALSLYQQLSTDSSSLYQDAALQKMARVYQDDLRQSRRARELYENLLEKFPESVFIEEVRKRIRQLENEP